MLTPDKIIEIFVKVDDFCKEFETEITRHQLDTTNTKLRNRKASLSDSEIITILITFIAVILPILSTFIFAISVPITNVIFQAWCLITALLNYSQEWLCP